MQIDISNFGCKKITHHLNNIISYFQVSVVFHLAATIKFNEELKDAVNTNFRGTKRVLHLCQRMKIIKVK